MLKSPSTVVATKASTRWLVPTAYLLTAILLGWRIASWGTLDAIALASLGLLLLALLASTRPQVLLPLQVLIILFPLGADVASIPKLLLYEVAIPIIFVTIWFNVVTARSRLSINTSPIYLPLTLFFLVVVANYVRNPLMPANLLGLSADVGGLRLYYTYLICLLVYVVSYYVTANKLDHPLWLKFLVYASAVLVALGLAGTVAGSQGFFFLPHYAWTVHVVEYGATRIGFVSQFSQLGLIALVAAFSRPSKTFWYVLAGLFGLGLIIGGGRAAFFSTLLAVLIWLRVGCKLSWTAIAALTVGAILAAMATAASVPNLQRLLLFAIDPGRLYTYQYEIGLFLRHPLFGVGLGTLSLDTGLTGWLADFVDQQVRFGGHGTYLALLKNFGLAGAIPFVWMLLRTGAGLLRLQRCLPAKERSYATFPLLYLIALAASAVWGGSGADPILFLVLGMANGLEVRHKAEQFVAKSSLRAQEEENAWVS